MNTVEPKGSIKKTSNKKKGKGQAEGREKTSSKKTGKKTKKKLTPKQEKALRTKKRILMITKWIILLAMLIGALTYFLLSPLFNIVEIQVSGNEKISTEQILSLSQLEIGNNIFQMRKERVTKKIKENPYIESVKIKRKLPNIVMLGIEERQATLQLQYINSYIYLNNQGYLLEIAEEKLENAPVLIGVETKEEDWKPGNRLEKEDLEKLEVVLRILESIRNNEIEEKVTQIDIQKKDDFVLYFDEENKRVYIGDEKELSTKMLWIKTMLEKEKGIEGELFLNKGMDSVFFREKV